MRTETIVIVGLLAYLYWRSQQQTQPDATVNGMPGSITNATALTASSQPEARAVTRASDGSMWAIGANRSIANIIGGQARYGLPLTRGSDGRLQPNPDAQYFGYTVPGLPMKIRL